MKLITAVIKPHKLEDVRQAVSVVGVEQVIEAITNAARTGKVGDGKSFVLDLEQVLRIRAGERGASAI